MKSSPTCRRAGLVAVVMFANACAHGSGRSPSPEGSDARKTASARNAQSPPTESAEKMLEGRFPGVSVMRTPEGGLRISIRGAASLRGDNAPLYIIDGVPVEPGPNGDLTGINPNDIESIKVLKNATDTTMYGVRGANGVIVIKTKRAGS